MKKNMEQFPAKNPNPVISVENDGTVLYSNAAGNPLLHEWGVGVGGRLPSDIKDLVQKVISLNSPEKMEVKAGKEVYSLAFHPIPKEEYVNIYGFDISDQKELEEKLQEQSEELQMQNEELQAQSEELQKANEELAESEERFRTMANAIPQLAWIARADGYRYWYNERWYAYTGTTPEQMEGWGWESVHDPALLPKVLEQWKVSIATGQMFNMELSLRGADGLYRQFLTRSFPLKDEKGQVFQWFGTNTDITERKQAEEKLQESAREKSLILDNINASIAFHDIDNCFVWANKVYLEAIGKHTTELKGRKCYACWGLDRLCCNCPVIKAIRTDQPQEGEMTPENQPHWPPNQGSWLVRAAPVKDAKGKIIGAIEVAHDITKLKEAEKALKESRDTLEEKVKERTGELEEAYSSLVENEEKYRNILETANEGIIVIDAESKVIYANQKMDYMLGYSITENIGKPISNFLREEESAGIIKVNMTKDWREMIEGYELELQHEDNSSVWALINSKPLYNAKNEFAGVMTMFTDITKRKMAEQVLVNIEIVRKQEIHHRIKNNLQVISSLLDLQAETFRDQECIKDSEVIEAFKESQDRVISMALIHEELHKGGEVDTLNFSSYIVELVDTLFLSYRVGNRDISYKTDMEENIYFDMDTAIPLGIIVNELISNSLKHAFIGRDKGEIRIKICREKSFESEDCKSTVYVLSVSDNGVGIPEDLEIEDLDSLGMQLVTTLVDQLDGELELKRDDGTEFVIRFTVIERSNQISKPALQQSI